jgi:hypothetical protein
VVARGFVAGELFPPVCRLPREEMGMHMEVDAVSQLAQRLKKFVRNHDFWTTHNEEQIRPSEDVIVGGPVHRRRIISGRFFICLPHSFKRRTVVEGRRFRG